MSSLAAQIFTARGHELVASAGLALVAVFAS